MNGLTRDGKRKVLTTRNRGGRETEIIGIVNPDTHAWPWIEMRDRVVFLQERLFQGRKRRIQLECLETISEIDLMTLIRSPCHDPSRVCDQNAMVRSQRATNKRIVFEPRHVLSLFSPMCV